MTKRKKTKHDESIWEIPLTVLGLIIFTITLVIVALFLLTADNTTTNEYDNYDESNSYCEDGYIICGDSCYSCNDGYYLGTDCQCYPDENTKYKETSEDWQEHVSILSNDEEKLEEYMDSYCSNLKYKDIPTCYNNLQPRLEVYANHIINAKNFLNQRGYVFSNRETLSANLDEEAIYVASNANWLSTTIAEYNNWVQTQQNEEAISNAREKALYDTISLLAPFA